MSEFNADMARELCSKGATFELRLDRALSSIKWAAKTGNGNTFISEVETDVAKAIAELGFEIYWANAAGRYSVIWDRDRIDMYGNQEKIYYNSKVRAEANGQCCKNSYEDGLKDGEERVELLIKGLENVIKRKSHSGPRVGIRMAEIAEGALERYVRSKPFNRSNQ